MIKCSHFGAYALPILCVVYLAGAYTAVLQPPSGLPHLFIYLFITFLCVVCISHYRRKRKCLGFYYLLCSLVFVSSFSFSANKLQRLIDRQLPSALEPQDVIVQGTVKSIISESDDYQRFLFDVEHLTPTKPVTFNGFSGVVRLSWKTYSAIGVGDNLRLRVRLKRPRGFVNPNGFDYQRWLLAQNIKATGYVKGKEYLQSSGGCCRLVRLLNGAYKQREELLHKLNVRLQGLSHASFIKALLVGDKSGIQPRQWAVFQQTGTVHLMAISGLHVGMVSVFSALLFGLIKRPLSFVFGPKTCAFATFLVCVIATFSYAFLAGFSIPTQRAFLCVFIIGLTVLIGRKTSFVHILGVVAVLVAIANPLVLIGSGFVLSFSAVLVLVVALAQRCGVTSKLAIFAKAQLVILFSLSPLMAWLDLPISFCAPLANTLAIPLLSFLILPLLFLGLGLMFVSDYASDIAFICANKLLALLESGLGLLTMPPYFQALDGAGIWLMLILAALFIVSPAPLRLAKYAYLMFGLVLLSQHSKPPQNTVKFTVLDVGQGLSTVLDDGHNRFIYDIGAKFSDSFSIANRVLLPFIQRSGKRDQVELMISHADNDHAGDAHNFVSDLVQYSRLPVIMSSGEAAKLDIKGMNQCLVGQALLPLEGLSARVLWPTSTKSVQDHSAIKANNFSCVVQFEVDGIVILLMGDIEKAVEAQLLRDGVLPKDIDVLVAPHHGSATSSTRALVDWLHPRHVVMSAGYKNRYHHPAKTVVKRYRAIGATIWNTAYQGAISITIEQGHLNLRAERCSKPKRWYLNDGYCKNQASS